MSFRDKVGSFLKREAKDLADAADSMRDKLDGELTKREQELAMTPSEKIKALQQQGSATDAKLDAIVDKVQGHSAQSSATAEMPSVTHVVMADRQPAAPASAVPGPPTVIDSSGEVVEIPIVQAPTAADLDKPPAPLIRASDAPSVPSSTVANVTPQATTPEPPARPLSALAPQAPQVAQSSNPTPQAAEPASSKPQAPAVSPPAPTTAGITAPAVAGASAPSTAGITASGPSGTAGQGSADSSETDYHKAPAQIKYERARAAANDLLDELRGELKADGEI